MANNDARAPERLRPIAPAPAKLSRLSGDETSEGTTETLMLHTCVPCTKRKVKCDKRAPICSRCRKSHLECTYQTPTPRSRKRRLGISNESQLLSKVARYESILNQHGLLNADLEEPCSREASADESISLHWNHPLSSGTGKLLAGEGKSRYISSNIWRNLGDDELQRVSDDEEAQDDDAQQESEPLGSIYGDLATDPLTGAFIGVQQNLLPHHPTHERAMALWNTYVDNVDPLCKILHVPSTAQMVEKVSQEPSMASRAEECVLFAAYHFAVYSMNDDECATRTGISRDTLLQQYHFAARQALVNASFLKTTELAVLQSLILLLMSSRFHYDSQTLWILTGVAVRIGQRIGLHQDGEDLGLSPFEIQMRRRLFYQLIPLDGFACQLAGAGSAVIPESWGTKPPLNVNDSQLWPGITETPEEKNGATDMMFCLARLCLGNYLARTGKSPSAGDVPVFKDYEEANKVINQAEQEIEEKYIRYCDAINPLHFLAMSLGRAGISAMRLRIRLPKYRKQIATHAEKREMLQIAMKILDTDAALHKHPDLGRFRWHMRPISLWGTWDSLIFVLTSFLQGAEIMSESEFNLAWKSIGLIFENHPTILQSKQPFDVALGRFALKAWDARPSSLETGEPRFITNLRFRQLERVRIRSKRQRNESSENSTNLTLSDPSPLSSVNPDSSVSENMEINCDDYLNMGDSDWFLWDFLSQ